MPPGSGRRENLAHTTQSISYRAHPRPLLKGADSARLAGRTFRIATGFGCVFSIYANQRRASVPSHSCATTSLAHWLEVIAIIVFIE
jgi:hypothetical protein